VVCPECGGEVLSEIAFCFACLKHVPEGTVEREREAALIDADTKDVDESSRRRVNGSWEPGILARVQTNWRKGNPETAR
jgi:hypothetical protein